jgi:hypothetical protein
VNEIVYLRVDSFEKVNHRFFPDEIRIKWIRVPNRKCVEFVNEALGNNRKLAIALNTEIGPKKRVTMWVRCEMVKLYQGDALVMGSSVGVCNGESGQ